MKTLSRKDRFFIQKARNSQLFIFKWFGIIVGLGFLFAIPMAAEIEIIQTPLFIAVAICYVLTMVIVPITLGLTQIYHASVLGFKIGIQYFRIHIIISLAYFFALFLEFSVLPKFATIEALLGELPGIMLAFGTPIALGLSFLYIIFFHLKIK